ncbi:hypothetical protein ID866_2146 [Astraeus odoratus]|nr:hypothetical protein ID866_2146 [Astraeus odoratus]
MSAADYSEQVPDAYRQPPLSIALAEKPRTIDALLHHPHAHTRSHTTASQAPPMDLYQRPSSSHSPTALASLLRQPPQLSPQTPVSPAASRSPTVSKDQQTTLSPTISSHRLSQSPVAAYHPTRAQFSHPQPLPQARSSPFAAPYSGLSVSSPETHTQAYQSRPLSSSTFALPHPHSPTDVLHQRHATYPFSGPAHAPISSATGVSPANTTASIGHGQPSTSKQRSSFVGLEALVHVASEERRRLSGGSSTSSTSAGATPDVAPGTTSLLGPAYLVSSTQSGSRVGQSSPGSGAPVASAPYPHHSSLTTCTSQHPPSAPHLQSPSRYLATHPLPPQQRTPPPTHFISHPRPHTPSPHREIGTVTFNNSGVPKMAGKVSLPRDDSSPSREVQPYQKSKFGPFSIEEELPPVQVQALGPVQAPIPRPAKVVWGDTADNPAREMGVPTVLQSSALNNWEMESRHHSPPTTNHIQQWQQVQHPLHKCPPMDGAPEVETTLDHFHEQLPEQSTPSPAHKSEVPAKQQDGVTIIALHTWKIEEAPPQECAKESVYPAKQDVESPLESAGNEIELECEDMQRHGEVTDGSTKQTSVPTTIVIARPPTPTLQEQTVCAPSSPIEQKFDDDPVPPLKSPSPPAPVCVPPDPHRRPVLQVHEEFSLPPSPPPVTELPEQSFSHPVTPTSLCSPSHPSPQSTPVLLPTIVESSASQESGHPDLQTETPECPSIQCPLPPHVPEEATPEELPDGYVNKALVVELSDSKPELKSEPLPETASSKTLEFSPLDVQCESKPETEVELEPAEPQVFQAIGNRERSPTSSPTVKTDGQNDAYNMDFLVATPSPYPTDRMSVAASESNQDAVADQMMDIDVDEELLSLVEDRRPARTHIPRTEKSTDGPVRRTSEIPEHGQPGLRASVAITDGERERESMPPPAPRTKKGDRVDKDKAASTTPDASGKKKKQESPSKPTAKPKHPQKSRVKPVPKLKGKPNPGEIHKDTSKGALIPKTPAGVASRSRSTSAMPPTDSKEEIVPEDHADEVDREDDKLYCVCKTQYDEDRVMIACDRCDEWYHTQCVNMPDLEIDLVDQFICPPCVKKKPELRTTWKRRCLFGLRHENPTSPGACHKPARGAFSKYCSDECGIKYMQLRISHWEASGGRRDVLWQSVKRAEKREGVVVRVDAFEAPNSAKVDGSSNGRLRIGPTSASTKRKIEWEISRLNARLEEVVKEREIVKGEMDMVLWREKVVSLASHRAEKVDKCGWDQRLCFGEEEWVDYGAEVLESYEKSEAGDEVMQVDGMSLPGHGEWWCTGKKKCERHAGWQKLRTAEVTLEKEMKEGILGKLTTSEREIRKRIEDILYPRTNGTSQTVLIPSSSEPRLNGTYSP